MKHKVLPVLATLSLLLGNSPSWGAASQPAPETVAGSAQLAPCISWRNPNIAPRYALLCVHGLGLYSKSWQNFAQRMTRFFTVTYAIDVRGFGSWMNAQGKGDLDFDGCLADIKSALEEIRVAHPGLPVFLLGESMGGAVALRAACMYPNLIDGVISAVPAGERFKQKRTDLKVAAEVVSGFHKNREGIGKQVVEQAATDSQAGKVNEKLAKAWEDDPLDRLDLSPKDLMQFQKFMNDNHDAVKKLTVPVLFLEGLDDDLVRPDGTWELMKDVGVHDRTLVALPSRHLMLEEAQTETPAQQKASLHSVLAWMISHAPDKAPIDPQDLRKVSTETATRLTQGLPTMVVFYAKWCDQCDQIQTFLNRPRAGAGRVRFVKFDVDNPDNQDLIKEMNVGAIPEIVYLKPDGTINSSLMGQTTAPVILKGVADLLRSTGSPSP